MVTVIQSLAGAPHSIGADAKCPLVTRAAVPAERASGTSGSGYAMAAQQRLPRRSLRRGPGAPGMVWWPGGGPAGIAFIDDRRAAVTVVTVA